jgi:hypothetical protein
LWRIAEASNVLPNETRSITQVNLNTLEAIRQQVYGCFERSADTLMELTGALSSE